MTEFIKDLHVSAKTETLAGLKITLCGGGGIAAIELPKVARELRRYGAKVRFFVTENCLRFVGKESLEWASEQPVIVTPSGFAEHICHDDAVIIMPTTADLIAKINYGICSDGVTTLVQSALGHKIPVLLCPTMHESLANSEIVKENRRKLSTVENIYFISPRIEEGKEKAPPPEILVMEASHIINANKKFERNKAPHICVTYGGTIAPLDDVRCITNRSTGSLGKELIKHAYRCGIKVTALEGNVINPMETSGSLIIKKLPDYNDMLNYLEQIDPSSFDGIFHIAAVSDFLPANITSGKIDCNSSELNMKLVKSKKFIALPNLQKIPFKFGCKLTSDSLSNGIEQARQLQAKEHLDAILWNTAHVFNDKDHTGVIITNMFGKEKEIALKTKQEIAHCMVTLFIHKWSNNENC